MRKRGGGSDDTLTGSSSSDDIAGGGSKDNLHGHGGNDLLNGEAGDDHLFGGDGDDRLLGGDGDDTGIGGQGVQTCRVLQHRRVAALAHVGQDGGDAALDLGVGLGRPVQHAPELGLEAGVAGVEPAQGNVHGLDTTARSNASMRARIGA